MNVKTSRSGISLLETILFIGILSIMATTITSVFIATQEARVLQNSIASLEDEGTQLIGRMSKTIRRAELIVFPSANQTGSSLVLQMANNNEFPTIVMASNSGMVLAQKSQTSALISTNITISDLTFKNVGGSNIWFSLTLSTSIPTIKNRTYSRVFKGTATLFPDDQSNAGGCGSCPAPACINNAFTWYVCELDICTQSDTTIPC